MASLEDQVEQRKRDAIELDIHNKAALILDKTKNIWKKRYGVYVGEMSVDNLSIYIAFHDREALEVSRCDISYDGDNVYTFSPFVRDRIEDKIDVFKPGDWLPAFEKLYESARQIPETKPVQVKKPVVDPNQAIKNRYGL